MALNRMFAKCFATGPWFGTGLLAVVLALSLGGGCLVEFSTERDIGVAADGSLDGGAHCGNGVREDSEACDGNDFNGLTCSSLGFSSGRLVCTSYCVIDTDGCAGRCGDGIRDAGEDCDGADLGDKSCEDFGYEAGVLSCGQGCRFDLTGCFGGTCGNGILDEGEDCDGSDLGGISCADLGFTGGELSCAPGCTLDVIDCVEAVCGNGVVEGEEYCDGEDLGGQSCESLGFARGSLACSPDCSFDGSHCFPSSRQCGDGLAQGAEYCDATDLRGLSCESLGYQGGSLHCGSNCRLVTSGCEGGDGSCDASSDSCEGCAQCSLYGDGPCGDALMACQNSQACSNVLDCSSNCQADAACMDDCGEQYPNGMALYNALAFCVVCNACRENCDLYGICQ